MSVQNPTTYNPEAVSLVIDGVIIDGIASDGITINREATSEFTEGMDSGGTLDHNPSRAYDVNVTMRASSNGARTMSILQKIAFVAMSAGSAHPNFSGVARVPISGSSITTGNVLFLNEPFPDFAMQSGTIEFQLKFVNAQPQIAPNLT